MTDTGFGVFDADRVERVREYVPGLLWPAQADGEALLAPAALYPDPSLPERSSPPSRSGPGMSLGGPEQPGPTLTRQENQ